MVKDIFGEIWKSRTVQDLIKVLAGNVVAQGIGFVVTIIISRDLGPENYGQFSLLLAIYSMSVQLFDFGVSTSLVQYGSEKRNDLKKYKDIIYTALIFKVSMSLLLSLIIYGLSKKLSLFFFNSERYYILISILGFSVVFNAIFGIILAHLQIQQKFSKYSFLNIANQILKLMGVVIVALCFNTSDHAEYFLYIYVYSYLAAILLFGAVNWRNLLIKEGGFFLEHLREIYKLGFWVFLSSLSVMIMSRLDIMMIQKLGVQKDVGFYSAANQLAMAFPLITSSLTTTLLPKASDFIRNHSIKEYINRILKNAKFVFLLLLLVEMVSPYVIIHLFGRVYENSIPIFQILVASYVVGIIINPISLVFYSLNKAYVLTILNWLQLPLNFLGNLYLIPLYGASGAALSTSLVKLFAGLYIFIAILKEARCDKSATYL